MNTERQGGCKVCEFRFGCTKRHTYPQYCFINRRIDEEREEQTSRIIKRLLCGY